MKKFNVKKTLTFSANEYPHEFGKGQCSKLTTKITITLPTEQKTKTQHTQCK